MESEFIDSTTKQKLKEQFDSLSIESLKPSQEMLNYGNIIFEASLFQKFPTG